MLRREFLFAGMAAPVFAEDRLNREKLREANELVQQATLSGRVTSVQMFVHHGRSAIEERRDGKVFIIASITKPMTAAGVMLLADRGELRLEDPLSRYIPEFTEGDRKRITFQHVLTHTCGLPDQLPENVELRRRQAPLTEYVERAIRTPLLFAPGEKYSYSSMGILLASEAAERITGQAFREFLRQEIFQPLGMGKTVLGLGDYTLDQVERSQVEHAEPLYGGGDDDTRQWDWNSRYWRDLGAPWGGAHSTTHDIARFLRAFLVPEENVLRPETARLMIQNHGWNRGLGFVVGGDSLGRNSSPSTFGHSGSTGTLCWCDPEKELTFVILSSLPARVSSKELLRPASDLVSEAL